MLHQWLWKWGDERQIARSIPQLDPQRIHALVNEKEISGRDGQIHGESLAESRTDDDDLSVLAARTALARGDVGEGIYKMLLVFQIFKLSLHWNPTSEVDTNMKSGLWYIIFLVRGNAILLAGMVTDYSPRSRHFAVSAFSPVVWRVSLTSMPSTSASNHCRSLRTPNLGRLCLSTYGNTATSAILQK